MPFKKGVPRLPNAGRKKGVPNKTPSAAKQFLKEIITSDDYRASFAYRARRGELSPPMEKYMWEMTVGKPKEGDQEISHAIKVMFGGRYKGDE